MQHETRKRKVIKKFRSLDTIKIEKINDIHDGSYSSVLLNGHKYKIINAERKFKKNNISRYHTTIDDVLYEITVELM